MTNSKPWVLGLTGGIASGKTTVSDYLASKGCLVADADAESRGLTAPGGAAMPEIERIFGADFIRPGGAMNRAKMRELVFSNDAARRTLESIIHPLVRKALMEKIRTGAENSRRHRDSAFSFHSSASADSQPASRDRLPDAAPV